MKHYRLMLMQFVAHLFPARYFRGLCESGHHASSAVDTGLSFRA